MSWRDDLGRVTINGKKLIAASYRGVPFFVEDNSRRGGRRAPTHEYPNRDKPYKEDLGRKARVFKLVGYVIGPDYVRQKRALIDALEEFSGPGDLRSPYDGKQKVICDDFDVTETKREGGIARFAMEFGETSAKIPLPGEILDKVANVAKKVQNVTVALREAAANIEDYGGLSGDFLTPAEDFIAAAGQAMNAPFAALTQTAEDLASIRRRMDRLVENAANLVTSPLAAFDAIMEALAFAFRPPTLPSAFQDLLNSSEIDFVTLPTPPVMTPSRIREAEIFNLIATQTRVAALMRISELAAESEIEIFQDAVTVRRSILRRLEEEAEATDDDQIFSTLTDLGTAVAGALPDPSRRLQQRATFTPNVSLPSLVITKRLYGDVSRELELVNQNRIAHPGFVMGGQPVEYVTNVGRSAG